MATRVLVVEDERSLRDTLARLLRALGHEAVTAASADEALRILGEERVDCVVTDLRLGETDGEALADQVRSEYPALERAVVLMSGLLRESKPGRPFLQKPFTADQLQKALALALT